ncbi:hypothetical protein [Microcella sp.]|uniref:hypothetical protein n=1 Tax=Microcella sp. TaxID=1913979 RepID=UPI00391BB357
MSIEFDFSQLDQMSANLDDAPTVAGPYLRKAVEVSARTLKDKWAAKLEGEPRMKHAHRSITYDISVFRGFGVSILEAEVGAERGRLQAPLVVINEFGAPGNNTAPRGYGSGALQETEPDFERGLSKALEDGTAEALRQSSTRGIIANYVNRGGA